VPRDNSNPSDVGIIGSKAERATRARPVVLFVGVARFQRDHKLPRFDSSVRDYDTTNLLR
jgi:hypothetical protein